MTCHSHVNTIPTPVFPVAVQSYGTVKGGGKICNNGIEFYGQTPDGIGTASDVFDDFRHLFRGAVGGIVAERQTEDDEHFRILFLRRLKHPP